MRSLFLHLVNMSITASWLILAIIVYRMIFRKAPKWIVTILWCLVGLRLICPITFESRFSLVPSENTIVMEQNGIVIESGFADVDSTINAYLDGARQETTTAAKTGTGNVYAISWLIGVCVLLVYSFVAYVRLKRSISDAVKYSDRVFQSEKIDSPFVIGIFKPIIYMSYGLSDDQIDCVLQHERAHIKRKDHLIKPLGFLLLCVYWFNPLVWIAYILLCHDIELACDERVIREIGFDKKKMYSLTLLSCSIPRRLIVACPVAFAEVGVKERVLNIMKMKKAKKGAVILACLGLMVASVTFMTKPYDDKATKIVYSDSVESEIVASEVQGAEEENAKNQDGEANEQEIATTEQQSSETQDEEQKNAENSDANMQITEVSNPETNNQNGAQSTQGNQTVNGELVSSVDTGNNESETASTQDNSASVTVDTNETSAAENVTVNVKFVHPVIGDICVITRAFSTEHKAIDFAAPVGTNLAAAIDGTVISTGYDDDNGNYLVIAAADGTTVYYNHCDTILVSNGATVSAGNAVATVGTTGKSTGPHLHFAVADASGNFIDPLSVIQ